MEDFIQAACDQRHIPGAVLMASNRSGTFTYSNVFGSRSLEDPQAEPLAKDSTMYIASCTKLVTSIAAMQCVERGLVALDEDLRGRVPELDGLDVLEIDAKGRYTGQHRSRSPITLRQLLTHTSGFAYEFNTPALQDWRKLQKTVPPPTSVRKRFLHPLIFEPGASWSYGPSIDWAGVVVEKVSGSPSLQEYLTKNIWEPLGIRDMTFFLSLRPDMQAKRAAMSWRTHSPAAVHSDRQQCFEPDVEDCMGGGGIYTHAGEYLKILRALLQAVDVAASDSSPPAAQLLRRSTARSMFEPSLDDNARKVLLRTFDMPRLNHMIANMPLGTRKDHGLGGLMVQEDLPGWRSKGTLTWGGTPNLTWWIDPVVGICGIYASQLIPIGDPKTNEMVHTFEKAMYERYAAYVKDRGSQGE